MKIKNSLQNKSTNKSIKIQFLFLFLDTTCKLFNDTYAEKLIRVPSETNFIGGTKDIGKTTQIGANKGGESQLLASEENQIAIPSQPQKAANLYFFLKIKLDSGKWKWLSFFFLCKFTSFFSSTEVIDIR